MISKAIVVWGAWCMLLACGPAAASRDDLEPCRIKGLAQDALCGVVRRPLDPSAPQGLQIDVHFAVLPALARKRKPDPVFFFAGGPGQSATALAPQLAHQFARVLYRRDLVLVDQRGTGRSAPLRCDDDAPSRPLGDAGLQQQLRQIQACRVALQKLPHGDLRHYTTTLAMGDVEAVRQLLGAAQVNLVGGSYGTRAALEYLRLFPQHVRRIVIDGVAPPDMVLPASFSPDAQMALEALLAACEADGDCRQSYGPLRERWAALLRSLPREVRVLHPLTGQDERFTLTHAMLMAMVRLPLYAPPLASALPYAISEAAQGRFTPLVGLAGSLGGGRTSSARMAMGMHFSVICAEDLPAFEAGGGDKPGKDFGEGFGQLYRQVCKDWPRGAVAPAFYRVLPAAVPGLVLSGGADPVTPPRHGERVAQALGPLVRHVVVPEAGHGVMGLGCMRDVLYRFIEAPDAAAAAAVDAGCARAIPRPKVFRPVTAARAGEAEESRR
jgi:pimeloyl-ACP methyl ester carboxylesterase